jgi:hypothetical protein
MNFKEYLAELNTENSQLIKVTDSVSITEPQVRDELNSQVNHELTDVILSPESGIQKIRKVLSMFGLDMPALYDAEPEGDEIVLDVDFTGDEKYYLYLIYYLADDGRYDFYAELVDDDGLEDIMSDEEEDEEE